MMNYRYLLEEKTNQNISSNDLISDAHNGTCVLNILCYYVDTSAKYPFLQFMMEKIQYSDISDELMILPHIFVRDKNSNISEIVLERVISEFDVFGYDLSKITEDMYKGIIYDKNEKNVYALVNISEIDMSRLNYMRQTTCWFVLPSEIINNQKVCDVLIDDNVINLFTENLQVGFLMDNKTNDFFMLPDVVFTSSELKQAEFQTIFGNLKQKVYDCEEYYFFYRSFSNIVQECKMLNNEHYVKMGDKIIVNNNDFNKYMVRCVNRYAVFVEGKMYFENSENLTLTDEKIASNYPEPCIIICYTRKDIIKPDILVKSNISFAPLSYLKLTKKILDKYN